MYTENIVLIVIGICFMFTIGSFASCTYKAGANYNECVMKASPENAQYCKVTR